MLKNVKYTQRYMKLLVSRLELPLSHSGANVINPGYISHCLHTKSHKYRLGLTAIQLPGSQDDPPKPQPGTAISSSDQLTDVQCQWPSPKYGQ